jgi:Holliday junction resolvase RusA-like endonuclease
MAAQPRIDGMGAALEIPASDETPGGTFHRVEHPAIRTLVIPGDPMPWARAGFNKKTGTHYPKADRKRRMAEIGMLWRGRRLATLGAVDVGAFFSFVWEHPKTHYDSGGHLRPKHIGTRPPRNYGDLDNLVKLVADALSEVAYDDDGQIAESADEKRWAGGGEESHTRVSFWPL